jgi:hypothetical protein
MNTQKERRFPCNQEGCEYNGDTKQHLNSHLWGVHSIGEGEIYKCEEEGCYYETRYKHHFNSHLRRIHNPDCQLFSCDQEGCDYKTKDSPDLKNIYGEFIVLEKEKYINVKKKDVILKQNILIV